MVKTNYVIHDVNKVCILVTFYIDFTFIAIAFIYKFRIWYCRALTLNQFWVSNLIQLLYLLQTFLPYFHFGRFIIITHVLIIFYNDNVDITFVGSNIYFNYCNIFISLQSSSVRVLWVHFYEFLSDQWARKNYSFINLKGKVIKLVSKIPRKNIHFQWFWWQK